MKELEDDSPMPFGKYKGQPMQDVPANYLHWLWTKGGLDKKHPIGVYIQKNLECLKEEYKDGIWTK